MSIKSTLIGAAALYALGRLTRDMSVEDVRRYASAVSGLDVDDVRKMAWDKTDDLLLRIGLQRAATVPSSAALVMGGIGAGLILGAGVTFFLMSDTGKSMRGRQTEEEQRATNGSEQTAGAA